MWSTKSRGILEHFHHLTDKIHARKLHAALRSTEGNAHLIHNTNDCICQASTLHLSLVTKINTIYSKLYPFMRNLIIRRAASEHPLEKGYQLNHIGLGGELCICTSETRNTRREYQCWKNLIYVELMSKRRREAEKRCIRQRGHTIVLGCNQPFNKAWKRGKYLPNGAEGETSALGRFSCLT